MGSTKVSSSNGKKATTVLFGSTIPYIYHESRGFCNQTRGARTLGNNFRLPLHVTRAYYHRHITLHPPVHRREATTAGANLLPEIPAHAIQISGDNSPFLGRDTSFFFSGASDESRNCTRNIAVVHRCQANDTRCYFACIIRLVSD